MSNTNRNILISCAVLLLVICVCLSAMAVTGVGIGLINRVRSSSNGGVFPTGAAPLRIPPTRTPAVSRTPSPTPTNGPSATPTLTPTPCPGGPCPTPTPEAVLPIPSAVAAQMDTIEEQVVEYRGLSANTTVVRHLISPQQLQDRVINDFLKDYTPDDARKDALVDYALGVLPANFDLLDFYKKFLSEQIAGFYDTKTNEMFVIQGETFSGEERLTYAHEYTHALQYQNFDIVNGLHYDDIPCKKETDRCAAIQSVIEGDATLSEQFWLLNFSTAQDNKDIQQFQNSLSLPVYDSAPKFIQDDELFPYRQGASFISDIYNQGGWAAIDRLFKDPPVSTEQILHPERYPDDKPVKVDLPDLTDVLGSGWKELDRNEMGAWYTYLILTDSLNSKARLSVQTATTAADGWGGDQYLYYYNDSAKTGVFVMVSEWDTAKDANEFASAFQKYGTARWAGQPVSNGDTLSWSGGEGFVSFSHTGQKTTWIIAPDQKTADSAAAALK